MDLPHLLTDPPPDCRPWTRWWWFGADITPEQIERELSFMAEHGYGGAEIAFVYAWPGADPGPKPLSPEWTELLKHAARTAQRLGLGLDITCGSGWPFGGPHISEHLTAWTVHVADCEETIGLDQRLVATVAAPILKQGSPPIADAGMVMRVDGDAPAGWVIARVFARHSGQQVKRAAPGQEGPVLDHFCKAALEAHLAAWGPPLLEVAGAAPVRALFCDSWEVEGPYWTPALPQQFQKRRGYDIVPLMPFILGFWQAPFPGAISQVLHDYGQTLHEMAMENFYLPFAEWCRAHGFLARVQTHGSPTEPLESYGTVDIPETETMLLPFANARLAASAARLWDRKVVTSETFTCPYGWPDRRMFAERPDDLKLTADQQFAHGVQQVVHHGFASSPHSDAGPGRHFYATTHLNHTLPWARGLREFNRYLARISCLMGCGVPVPDVAVYLPIHDVWRRASRSSVEEMFSWDDRRSALHMPQALAGYCYDWVNDAAVRAMVAHEGRVRLREIEYPALVLPTLEYLPSATADAIRRFAAAGVPAYADKPVPESLSTLVLPIDRLNLPPAVQVSPGPAAYQHRRLAGGDIFFIGPRVSGPTYPMPYRFARSLSDKQEVVLTFPRHTAMQTASLWSEAESQSLRSGRGGLGRVSDSVPPHLTRIDAWTGRFERVAPQVDNGNLVVHLGLPAAEPIILLLSDYSVEADDPYPPLVECRVPGSFVLTLPDGTCRRMDHLEDWRAIAGLRDFSGALEYRLDLHFDVLPPSPIFLDLGEVEIMAELTLNDGPQGLTLCRPHRFRLDPHLRIGSNRVTVKVTNLAFNSVQARRNSLWAPIPLPGLTAEEWDGLLRAGMLDEPNERLPSGLLGPVRLLHARS